MNDGVGGISIAWQSVIKKMVIPRNHPYPIARHFSRLGVVSSCFVPPSIRAPVPCLSFSWH